MDIWTVSTFWLLWIKLPWTFMCNFFGLFFPSFFKFIYKFLCGHMFAFISGVYLGVEFLSHMVTLCSFEELPDCFSKVLHPFIFPPTSVWGFHFLILVFLIISSLFLLFLGWQSVGYWSFALILLGLSFFSYFSLLCNSKFCLLGRFSLVYLLILFTYF